MTLAVFTYSDYSILCKKLGFSPREEVYSNIFQYLNDIENDNNFDKARFSIYLESIGINKVNAIFFDALTAVTIKNHKYRHAINAILAYHECDYISFEELRLRSSQSNWVLKLLYSLIKVPFVFICTFFWGVYHHIVFNMFGFVSFHDFDGKTILITGSSGDVAQQLIARVAGPNVRLICVYHNKLPQNKLLENSILVQSDLSMPLDLIGKLDAIDVKPGDIDLVFWCAGVKMQAVSSHNIEKLIKTFYVNTISPAAFYDWYCENHSGHFIVLSSLGRYHGFPNTNGYNASKAALSILFESIVMENSITSSGASVTVVEPGLIKTGMNSNTVLSNLLSIPCNDAISIILGSTIKNNLFVKFPSFFRLLLFGLMGVGYKIRVRLISKLL